MCGIAGMISADPCEENYKIFTKLMDRSMVRGMDATGICFLNVQKKKFWVGKHHVSADKFWAGTVEKKKGELVASPLCIGHTRAWTTGKPGNNANNHPIYSKDWIMIHNGVCVFTKKVEGYEYMGDVDSELLLAQIQKNGIEEGLRNGTGDAALALIPRPYKGGEPILYLYRHKCPMWLAHKKGEPTVFFGSTESIIRGGCSTLLGFFCEYYVQELPEDELWKVTIKKGEPLIEMVKYIGYGIHHITPSSGTQGKITYYYCRYCSSSFIDKELKNKHEGTCRKNPAVGTQHLSQPSQVARPKVPLDQIDKTLLPIDWKRYWNVQHKAWTYADPVKWKYDPKIRAFTYPTNLVRWYDVEEEKCLVADPKWALDKGVIPKLPKTDQSGRGEK